MKYALQCVAVCCSMCSAVCCSELQCAAVWAECASSIPNEIPECQHELHYCAFQMKVAMFLKPPRTSHLPTFLCSKILLGVHRVDIPTCLDVYRVHVSHIRMCELHENTCMYSYVSKVTGMVWLRLVSFLELYVSFAKELYTRDDILQKTF